MRFCSITSATATSPQARWRTRSLHRADTERTQSGHRWHAPVSASCPSLRWRGSTHPPVRCHKLREGAGSCGVPVSSSDLQRAAFSACTGSAISHPFPPAGGGRRAAQTWAACFRRWSNGPPPAPHPPGAPSQCARRAALHANPAGCPPQARMPLPHASPRAARRAACRGRGGLGQRRLLQSTEGAVWLLRRRPECRHATLPNERAAHAALPYERAAPLQVSAQHFRGSGSYVNWEQAGALSPPHPSSGVFDWDPPPLSPHSHLCVSGPCGFRALWCYGGGSAALPICGADKALRTLRTELGSACSGFCAGHCLCGSVQRSPPGGRGDGGSWMWLCRCVPAMCSVLCVCPISDRWPL